MNNQEKAKRLHRENLIVDAHLDLADELLYRYMNGEEDVIRRYYLEHWRTAGIRLIVCAIFVDNLFLPEMGLKNALKQIELLHKDVEFCSDDVVIAKSRAGLEEALQSGKIVIIMSLEGLEPIGNDEGMLRIFYELGVRAAGLVWGRRNFVGDGSFFAPRDEGKKGGLTDFGVRAVREMERLGMLVDISHLNDEGVADVVQFTKKPFIASHSNARALVPLVRNLTDEQLLQVAASGGVVGVNGIRKFLLGADQKDPVDCICDHIEYMVNLIGEDHVGCGFDLCDSLTSCELRFEFGEPEPGDALKNHTEMLLVTEKLLDRGMSEQTIIKVMGKNFLNLFREVLR